MTHHILSYNRTKQWYKWSWVKQQSHWWYNKATRERERSQPHRDYACYWVKDAHPLLSKPVLEMPLWLLVLWQFSSSWRHSTKEIELVTAQHTGRVQDNTRLPCSKHFFTSWRVTCVLLLNSLTLSKVADDAIFLVSYVLTSFWFFFGLLYSLLPARYTDIYSSHYVRFRLGHLDNHLEDTKEGFISGWKRICLDLHFTRVSPWLR